MQSLDLIIFVLGGLIVGILLAIVLIILSRTNHSIKGEYDERQRLMKGRAFESATFTGLGYSLLVYIMDLGGVDIPMQTGLIVLVGGILSILVYVTQAIITDAYIGLNEKFGRTMLLFAFCAIFNAFPLISNIRNGLLVKNGMLTNSCGNVIIVFMILYVMIIMTIKHLLSDREGSDEES